MLDQIEHLVSGIRRVSDNIAHDLRTPLTRLKHRLEELSQKSDRASAPLALQCVEESDQLLATFSALLRIARLENRGHALRLSEVDLHEMAGDVVELYEPLAQQKHQHLFLKGAPGAVTRVDRDLMFQAIANLVDNAVKYSPAGSHIEVSFRTSRSRVELTVRDDGPGVSEADEQRLLQRFFRGEPARSTPGNGLGLSLVEAIVRLHNGGLHIQNRNPGLEVKIEWPASSAMESVESQAGNDQGQGGT